MVTMADEVKKIMIVEDDRFLSFLMKARLEKEGFAVTQVFDGEEAINALRQEAPSLVILDLIMPKVTGFEVLKMISTSPTLASVPVVIVSNLAQDSDIEKARDGLRARGTKLQSNAHCSPKRSSSVPR